MKNNKLDNLNTELIGRKVIHYQTIDSTQKEVWRRITAGDIENGTIIIADLQTDAIGTHGRKWYTTEEKNIAFSFVVYPNVDVAKLKHLTIDIANIIVQVFSKLYGVELEIKAPNDIVVGHKKIGGILIETVLQGQTVKNLVIGIGINTNQEVFEKEIENIASSIRNEFGIEVNNEEVIAIFCYYFEEKIWKKLL